jgi:hypothetical protein
MPTLTRSVGFSVREYGTVLPLNRMHSTAVFETRSETKIVSQKLNLRSSPIGGLEIGWKDLTVKTVSELESDQGILGRTLDFHKKRGTRKADFWVNEAELWILKPIYTEVEVWAPLLLEAVISGIGMPRTPLREALDEICLEVVCCRLTPAYMRYNFRVDPLYVDLTRKGKNKDKVMQLVKSVAEEPHKTLGLTWGHVTSLSDKEIKRYQLCRPFWATNIDELEEILQTPLAEIFCLARGVRSTAIGESNACCRAAENLGYTLPSVFNEAAIQQPLVEVKPAAEEVLIEQ